MNPSKLFALFDKARQTLKYPALMIPDEENKAQIKLSIGNDPNTIWVSNGFARSDPANKLYGKFVRGYTLFHEYKPSMNHIHNTLSQLCEDPIKFSVIHGQQYKHCCFCNTELTSKASLFAGYGPICADNWGLPWGEIKDESLENL